MTNLIDYLNNNLTLKIGYKGTINEEKIINELKNINEINKNEYEYNNNNGIGKKSINLCDIETFTFYTINFFKDNIKEKEYLIFKNYDNNSILFEKELLYK